MVHEVDLSYDTIVEQYYETNKSIPEVEIPLRKAFIEKIPLRGNILDLACGPGRDAKYFSELGFSVVGVDIAPNMIAKAKYVAPKATFQVMDMRALKFDVNSFDAVFFNAALLCVEKKHAPSILARIHELIAAGPLLLQVKEGIGEEIMFDSRYGVNRHFAHYTTEEITSLLTTAGFDVIQVDRHASSKNNNIFFLTLLCMKA